MHQIYADIAKNRMYLTIRGTISLEESQQIHQELLETIQKLTPGFGVISDACGTLPAVEEVRLQMQQTMKACKDAGMGHVVRVSSNPVINNLWQRTSRRIGYTASEAPSLAEADALLDKLGAA